ncbi:MAG: AAA family ATPase, partial [Clostridiales bacterium]|nr:AAA family ATPase [Clostridiales bacterium]
MKKTLVLIMYTAVCFAALGAVLYFKGDAELSARLMVAALFGGLIFYFAGGKRERATGLSRRFGAIQATPAASSLTFADVAANQEARESLQGLVDYLKDPEKYRRMGARMPRGVLLYGPPGTGKTLLARALAGEAGVPFFPLSGSDFVQMYVGVGASRVRDLFQKARKAGRCVIFIDEIDAMGKRRDDASSDEREQTLNALLSEMSGFRQDDGAIVLAATNRIDSLDPALLRPGRFDRHIEVGLPGRGERLSILQLHSRNKPLDTSVDLSRLAGDTVRFSGASLESLLNEAALRAARRGAEAIDDGDIRAAYVATVAGEDRSADAISREERAVIALHEAGHALAMRRLLPDYRLSRVSILPASRGAAGYNLSIPTENAIVARDQLRAQIDVLLAGRAAEMLIGGDDALTSGASSDLSRAAELAAAMVLDLGMADDAAVSLRALQKAGAGASPDALAKCR